MCRALDEFHVKGIATTAAFHRSLLRDSVFIDGQMDTKYVERMLAD
jgi:biotin carboxylase